MKLEDLKPGTVYTGTLKIEKEDWTFIFSYLLGDRIIIRQSGTMYDDYFDDAYQGFFRKDDFISIREATPEESDWLFEHIKTSENED